MRIILPSLPKLAMIIGALYAAGIGYQQILPSYLDQYAVRKALRALAHNPGVTEMNRSEMRQHLDRALTLEGVDDEIKKSLRIIRYQRLSLLEYRYEQRRHIAGNVSVILKFQEQLDLNAPEQCCLPVVDVDALLKEPDRW